MEIVEVVDLTSEEKIFVFNLWNAEYPAKIAYDKVSDLDGFLGDLSESKICNWFFNSKDLTGWCISPSLQMKQVAGLFESEKWKSLRMGH